MTKEVGVTRIRMWGVVLAVGMAMGGQPQGCDKADTGEMGRSFTYLTEEPGYRPPVPDDVTVYQTNGPITAGSIQTLAEGIDGTIYAGTFGDGVFTKAPGSERWIPAERGPSDRFVMTFLPMPDGSMIAGTLRAGLFRTDDGRRWEASGEGLGNDQVPALLRNPRDGTLYAGTGAGVFRSTDGGHRWTAVNRTMERALARSLALGENGVVYAGTAGNGLFVSRNRGDTWKSQNEGLSDERGLRENFIRVLTTGSDGTLYAGSFGGGVYRSRDGSRWTPTNEGLSNLSIRAIVVGPEALYVATGDGVYRSGDRGRQWESISGNLADSPVQSLLLSRDGTLYAGTSTGVMVRRDDGSWEMSDRGMRFPVVTSLAVDQERGFFAGTSVNGLYRTKDSGQLWSLLHDGIQLPTILSVVVGAGAAQFAATPEHIYRADWERSLWLADEDGVVGAPISLVSDGVTVYALTTDSLFARTAESEAWTRIALPEGEGSLNQTLDREKRPVLASGRAVFRLSDDRSRWHPLGALPGDRPVLGIAAGHAEYGWTSDAVYARSGRSNRWTVIGEGLPEGAQIRMLAVDAGGRDDVILAATTAGIWWRDRDGEWRPAQGEAALVAFESVVVPASGLVMAGSSENGVFVGLNRAVKRGWLFGG